MQLPSAEKFKSFLIPTALTAILTEAVGAGLGAINNMYSAQPKPLVKKPLAGYEKGIDLDMAQQKQAAFESGVNYFCEQVGFDTDDRKAMLMLVKQAIDYNPSANTGQPTQPQTPPPTPQPAPQAPGIMKQIGQGIDNAFGWTPGHGGVSQIKDYVSSALPGAVKRTLNDTPVIGGMLRAGDPTYLEHWQAQARQGGMPPEQGNIWAAQQYGNAFAKGRSSFIDQARAMTQPMTDNNVPIPAGMFSKDMEAQAQRYGVNLMNPMSYAKPLSPYSGQGIHPEARNLAQQEYQNFIRGGHDPMSAARMAAHGRGAIFDELRPQKQHTGGTGGSYVNQRGSAPLASYNGQNGGNYNGAYRNKGPVNRGRQFVGQDAVDTMMANHGGVNPGTAQINQDNGEVTHLDHGFGPLDSSSSQPRDLGPYSVFRPKGIYTDQKTLNEWKPEGSNRMEMEPGSGEVLGINNPSGISKPSGGFGAVNVPQNTAPHANEYSTSTAPSANVNNGQFKTKPLGAQPGPGAVGPKPITTAATNSESAPAITQESNQSEDSQVANSGTDYTLPGTFKDERLPGTRSSTGDQKLNFYEKSNPRGAMPLQGRSEQYLSRYSDHPLQDTAVPDGLDPTAMPNSSPPSNPGDAAGNYSSQISPGANWRNKPSTPGSPQVEPDPHTARERPPYWDNEGKLTRLTQPPETYPEPHTPIARDGTILNHPMERDLFPEGYTEHEGISVLKNNPNLPANKLSTPSQSPLPSMPNNANTLSYPENRPWLKKTSGLRKKSDNLLEPSSFSPKGPFPFHQPVPRPIDIGGGGGSWSKVNPMISMSKQAPTPFNNVPIPPELGIQRSPVLGNGTPVAKKPGM